MRKYQRISWYWKWCNCKARWHGSLQRKHFNIETHYASFFQCGLCRVCVCEFFSFSYLTHKIKRRTINYNMLWPFLYVTIHRLSVGYSLIPHCCSFHPFCVTIASMKFNMPSSHKISAQKTCFFSHVCVSHISREEKL